MNDTYALLMDAATPLRPDIFCADLLKLKVFCMSYFLIKSTLSLHRFIRLHLHLLMIK
jgi:hypothetical protein